MHKLYATAVALAALILAPSALAQTTPIATEQDKVWIHKETGVGFPVSADGFVRDNAFDFGKTSSDIAFQYREASSGTLATIYFYRAGLPHVSIWAERTEAAMLGRGDAYGKFDLAGRRWGRFSPTTGGQNSAIWFSYPLSGSRTIATGGAFAQRGDWLIKVRMSSDTLNAEKIGARLESLLAALAIKPAGGAPAPAYAIKPCPTDLVLKPAKSAGSNKSDFGFESAIVNSLVPLAAEEGKATPAKQVVFCRDGAVVRSGAVYRPDGANDSYVLTLGDGGTVITAAPDAAAVLLGKGKPQFLVTLITSDRLVGFHPFKSLPTPDQALQLLDKGPASYARSRMSGDNNVEIFAPRN